MITSVDRGLSIKVATPPPCPFQPATKFNLTGLNELAVDDAFNLNLRTISLSNDVNGIGELVAHVKVVLIIAFELVMLYE
jgi:hypothetical protein